MDIKIRFAEFSDIEAIRSILNHEIENGTAVYHYEKKSFSEMEEWFEDKKRFNFPIYVAEIDQEFIGYATYGTFRPHKGFQYTVEHSIYLSPNSVGHGIGQKLMRVLIEHAKQQNFHIMLAFVDASNNASCQFHHKLGFKEVGILKEVGNKFNTWLDIKILELKLNDN